MAYSYQLHAGTGAQTSFSYTGIDGFLSTSHLYVYVDNVLKAAGTHYTVNTVTNSIVFTAGNIPTAGAVVKIQRITPKGTAERTVDFTDGSVLTAQDLDASTLQLLYMAQEASDDTSAAIGPNYTGSAWDAGTKRLTNVANPLESQDAVTKTYVDQLALFGGVSSDPQSWSFTAVNAQQQYTLPNPAPLNLNKEFFIVQIGGVVQPTANYSLTFNGTNYYLNLPAAVANTVASGANITIRNFGTTRAANTGSVGTTSIADQAITTAKIADGAVGNTQLADGAVTNAKIADGTIDEAKLAVAPVSLTTSQTITGTKTLKKTGSSLIIKAADDNTTINVSSATSGSQGTYGTIALTRTGTALQTTPSSALAVTEVVGSTVTSTVNLTSDGSLSLNKDLSAPNGLATLNNVTVNGTMTYNGTVSVPTPTLGVHAANKTYVDAADATAAKYSGSGVGTVNIAYFANSLGSPSFTQSASGLTYVSSPSPTIRASVGTWTAIYTKHDFSSGAVDMGIATVTTSSSTIPASSGSEVNVIAIRTA